jgi:hypothetical protein
MATMVNRIVRAATMALAIGASAAIEAQTQTPGLPDAQAVRQALEPSGPHEGIKVHGDWTIVVRNPDGTVAARYEFTNSLRGDLFLSQVFARAMTPGKWDVFIDAPGVCPNTAFCFIAEPNAPILGHSQSLTVTVGGDDGKKLIFSGTVRASNAGQLRGVGTENWACPGSVAPASCAAGQSAGAHTFTNHVLNPAIPVAANQAIDVTVVISFS